MRTTEAIVVVGTETLEVVPEELELQDETSKPNGTRQGSNWLNFITETF
jgi:hypothetical protein